MKTKYRFIEFTIQETLVNDRPRWICFNRKHAEQLGVVVYNPPWRQYVYEPTGPAIYSASCLLDIAEFVKACAT